jgi:hypothetical protein
MQDRPPAALWCSLASGAAVASDSRRRLRSQFGQEATVTSDRFAERDRCASRLSAGGLEAVAIAELLDVACNPRRP